MARKETYRERYTNKLIQAGKEPIKKERKERIPIDPAIQQPYIDGKVILINKPLHWTSFDVVRKLRSLLQIKKIGHAGTLDPLATGLLIVCTGKFTKKINEYMAQLHQPMTWRASPGSKRIFLLLHWQCLKLQLKNLLEI